MSHAEFHNDKSLGVNCEVRVAQRLTSQVLATCRAPASRLLQGHDRCTERRQTSDAVWARSQVPRCAYCVWSAVGRSRRLGWPTQNCQVDHYFVPFSINWHVMNALIMFLLVMIMMMMMMMITVNQWSNGNTFPQRTISNHYFAIFRLPFWFVCLHQARLAVGALCSWTVW